MWQGAIPGVPIELRYWSMCNNDQVVPYPVVGCASDWQTALDGDGFYTYVLGDSPGGKAPHWLPAHTTWLPQGLKKHPNILIFRNMLPEADFPYSVQDRGGSNEGFLVDNTNHRTPTDGGNQRRRRMRGAVHGRLLSAGSLLRQARAGRPRIAGVLRDRRPADPLSYTTTM